MTIRCAAHAARRISPPRRRTLLTRAIGGALPLILSPLAVFAYDNRFDYTSFESTFGQAQFDVLNYPSINGNYMMTSTDNHRPEMVANGNNLAEFYNWLQQRYEAHPTKDGALSADEIDAYVVNNSANNGPKPNWIILNEISASLWPPNAGPPSNSTYRTWLLDTVTRLHDHYGYEVITLAPYQNPAANDASWQALAEVSYVGIECYLSGTEVWNSGSTTAQRLSWAQSQYQASKNSYLNRGVPADRLFVTEHFANNDTTYTDGQGNELPTGWGRAGLASAADWDSVIQIRQDAILNVGFDGILAYNWGGNGMGVTQAEQIQHEYYYRTRRALASEKPQWLSNSAINVNGAVIPLSWSQPLNWKGGVPNAGGAEANFWRTLTANRTIALDGSKTVGKITFDSAFSYTISPGTGGSLTLNNSGAAATLTSTQGSHNIAVNVQLTNGLSAAINTGTFTINGSVSGAGGLTKSGAGTLTLSAANTYSGGTTITAGTLLANAGNALPGGGAVNVNSGTLNITANSQSVGTVTLTSGAISGTTGTLSATSFNLQSGSVSAILGGAGAAVTKTGAGTVTLTGANSYGGGTAVNAGTLQIGTGGTSGSIAGNITNNAAVVFNRSNATSVGNIDGAGTLTKSGTGTLTVSRFRQSGATVSAGTLRVALSESGETNRLTASLSISPGAALDLTNNHLIVDDGSYSAVESLVKQGFNGGNWSGAGIRSSSAAADTSFVTALGIVNNADIAYSSFGDFTDLNGDEILIKFTYYGDADLGGTVNLDDFNQFLFGYNPANSAPQIWLNGDFNYTGAVNLDDFNLFLFGLANQGGALVSPELFAALSEFVTSEGIDVDVSTVPEPAALSLLALGSLLLSRRRRRA